MRSLLERMWPRRRKYLYHYWAAYPQAGQWHEVDGTILLDYPIQTHKGAEAVKGIVDAKFGGPGADQIIMRSLTLL